MKPRKLRNRLAVASSLGVVALAVALVGLAGPASAGAPVVPAFPNASVSGQTVPSPDASGGQQFGTYPNWLPANESVSNVDHSEGSDTTLFMMESISNLYAQAGIIPFACNVSTSNTGTCNGTNNTQTDEFDNYAGTEELQGLNDVGSGNGIGELGCATSPAPPSGTTVDYSRSSKAPGTGNACGSNGFIDGIGYAKDAVIPLDFQSIDPEAYMSTGDEAPGYVGTNFISYCQTTTQPGCTSIGQTLNTAFPSSGIGPVAAGWLPTDSFTCVAAPIPADQGTANYCSGTPFANITNTTDPNASTGAGATSVAFRLFCQHGPVTTTPYESQIMDWGNLTNLSAAANGGTAVPIGDGAPIGVPIRIVGVNTGSGTTQTFYTYAQSGILAGGTSPGDGCTGNSSGSPLGAGSLDVNAASQSNPQTAQGPAGGSGNTELALENDVNQVGDFAEADWAAQPTTPTFADAADQAIDIATSLYFESLGVYSTNPNAQVASIETPTGSTSGLIPSGQPSTFLAAQMSANGLKGSLTNELPNTYAMSRTLFNVLATGKIKASVGGFVNWMCDSNGAFQKGQDHVNGGNFNTDLTNLILGQYGFQQLSDTTAELAVNKQTVAGDNIAGNVNGSCAASLPVASTGGVGTNTITVGTLGSSSTPTAPPAPVQVGWPVSLPAGSSVATPSNTVILGISNSPTPGVISLGTTTGGPSTTVAAASNGGHLGSVATWSTPGAGELAVASVSGLPTSGVAQVKTAGGNAYVAYTGVDTVDNYLTGVTFLSQSNVGSATTVSTGGTVTVLQTQNLVGGSGGSAPPTLYFPGHPPVLSVTSNNT